MQATRRLLNLGALLYLIILTFQMTVLGLIEDRLLFKSDLVSLGLFSLLLSFCGFAVAIPGLAVAYAATRRTTVLESALASACVAGFVFGFIIYGIEVFVTRVQDVWLFVGLCAALYTGCFLGVWRLREQVTNDAMRLARVVAVSAVVMFASLEGWTILSRSAVPDAPRHVVLIVLDGFSAAYLSPYEPRADTPAFEELADRMRLFTAARTNFTHTHGYFGTLYSGAKDRKVWRANVFDLLQGKGVNTRWVTNHNNGVPDAYPGPSGSVRYRGLRSALLNQHYSWIPERFGLDYNIFLYRPGGGGVPMGRRDRAMYQLANHSPGGLQLDHFLETEVRRLRSAGRSSFLMFHTTGWAPELSKRRPELWKEVRGTGARAAAEKRIRAAEYTYEERDAWVVDIWSDNLEKRCALASERLLRFFEVYQRERWDRDTLLIVTADHGKIYGRGRAFYGPHADEAVARVPLLVHSAGARGRDDRLVETIDITATLLEYFGVDQKLSADAISLLGDEHKQIVTTLTTRAKQRREQFLSIYSADYKHTFNVFDPRHPIRTQARVRGFEDLRVPLTTEDPALTPDLLPKVLADYGL
jgi:hypothetical protein